MNINLKSLIARLNDTCRSALEGAAGLCLSRTNYDVEIEHYLLKLIEGAETDLARILRHYEVNSARLSRDLARALDQLKTGNARTPALSPRLPQWVQEAWMLASIECGESKVRSGHLALALLNNDYLARLALEISSEFSRIRGDSLFERFAEITAGSAEEREALSLGDHRGWGASASDGQTSMTPGVSGQTRSILCSGAISRFAR
jgi:type VI secretion system protein VasG